MKKNAIIVAALAAALPLTIAASPAENALGQGNGTVNGCTLANNSEYKNPAEMFKYLTERDGHFQNTVDKYSSFDTVADLIDQKCGD